MIVPITALYAGVLALIVGVLGFQVGSTRSRVGISILHGDDMDLAEKIRRHANFTENVPLALILMAVLELNGCSTGSVSSSCWRASPIRSGSTTTTCDTRCARSAPAARSW